MRILCFIDHYLPGFRSGGPLQTIKNLIENLGDEFEFYVVTRDRDLGAEKPYENIQINEWNKVGKANVFYISPSILSFQKISRLISDTQYDVMYLNSFFSPIMTGLPLLNRLIGWSNRKPVVLAPRGEFSAGALKLKRGKKNIYIVISKLFRLYHDLIWQASNKYEAKDIRLVLGRIAKNIIVAQDLLPLFQKRIKCCHKKHYTIRNPGPPRLIFLSRISPMKNLDFLLRLLKKTRVELQLTIYGPKEDLDYWSKCKSLINTLPSNIFVQYVGEIPSEQVSTAFAEHDVFVFPSRGENFGHVVFESLAAGTSVILSDQTPWQSDSDGAVEVLSLDFTDTWVAAIEKWSQFDDEDFSAQRTAASNFANDYVAKSPAIEQNRELFFEAVKENKVVYV